MKQTVSHGPCTAQRRTHALKAVDVRNQDTTTSTARDEKNGRAAVVAQLWVHVRKLRSCLRCKPIARPASPEQQGCCQPTRYVAKSSAISPDTMLTTPVYGRGWPGWLRVTHS
jgi:hypothetical protein